MRKIKVAVLLLLLSISLFGCKSTSDATYNKDTQDEEQQTENNEDTQVTENQDDDSEETKDSTDSGESEEDTTQDATSDDSLETPLANAYPNVSDPIDFDTSSYDDVTGTIVDDSDLEADLLDYMNSIYFNYYFTESVDTETGTITGDSMVLFALSYIMQHENEELTFDYETYRLYIPAKRVSEITEKFFYRTLDEKKSYEDYDVDYDAEKDEYSVVVEDQQWNVELSLKSVYQLGQFTYKAVYDLTDKDTGNVTQEIVAIIDETNHTPVIYNYKIVDVASSDTQDTSATTDAESSDSAE